MPKFPEMGMKDSATAPARVYVGGLGEGAEAEELHELFKEFGTVLGVKITTRGYGFVQFEEESSAQAAILNRNLKFHGRNLIVKIAKQSRMPGGPPSESGGMEERRPYRDRSPLPHRTAYSGDWGEERYSRVSETREAYRSPEAVQLYRHPGTAPDKNDCEIIVVSKALTEYAEFIEEKLKRLGLMVDLLFPNEDVPIGRVLGNISSRGCLYAILVMPQNLQHHSLTLDILHGLPQEHRNMPLEDAMELISRNWAEYRSSGRVAGRAALLGHLKQLASGHSLTVLQYDTVLQYLKECREKQVKLELGEAAVDSSSRTQVDLQQRIMSILNSEGEQPSAPTPLLGNPSVQMALDSLLNKII